MVAREPSPEMTPTFYYDFNSPYAYLAASRVDQILPVGPRWQPIAFAFLLRARSRTPWSMQEATREAGVRECERRAELYGLPELRWPPGWPIESYSLLPLRAAYLANAHGRLREFSRKAFARNFVDGIGLTALKDVVAVARASGLDPQLVEREAESAQNKEALRAATDEALARGVYGVPTVAIGDELFWGDDQLAAAADVLG